MTRHLRTCLIATLVTASLTAAGACGPPGDGEGNGEDLAAAARSLFAGDGARWVDLSWSFGDSTIYWPTAESFELEVVAADSTEAGYYYAANDFSAAEHGGTHLDAPVHFHAGGATVEELPVDRLVGPAVVVDATASAAEDPDYRVRVEDLEAWEDAHGRIPDGAIVLLRTGWGERWPDRERYLGTDRTGPEAVPELHFPGLHPDAARWLAEERSVDAVGLDTPSIDYGQSADFMAHRVLYAAGIPGLENVARLEELPATGAYVVALPMKITGGSGGPLRIVAVIPRSG